MDNDNQKVAPLEAQVATPVLVEIDHESDYVEPAAKAPIEDAPAGANDDEHDGWDRTPAQSTTVRQDFEVTSPLDKPWDPSQLLLAVPGDDAKTIQQAIDARPNIDITDTQSGLEWVNNLNASRVAVSYGGLLNKATLRPGAQYRQGVLAEKGILNAGNVRFRDTGDARLTGERAVLRVRGLLGLGSVIRIPLWHSGFWISLKAPSEASLLELNRKLTEEKITLGRSTFGMAFANTTVFFAGWIMDFALSHVYDSTLTPEAESNMRELIRAEDIPLIAWGLACVCWPQGFPYARAVLDPKAGEKVIKEKLNINKLLWVDNSALTAWQITHMSKIHGHHHAVTDLERYRKEFTRGHGREIVINEDMSIQLRSPTMTQYLNSGQKWINNIVHMVDKTFEQPTNEQVRDSYIWDQGKATNMRQYAHFVESIKVTGGEGQPDDIIVDEDTIDSIIDALSSDPDTRKKYFDGIKGYIEDSVISIVAIPATEKEDTATLPRFPNLLVLDTLSVFFTLLVQKIPQIRDR